MGEDFMLLSSAKFELSSAGREPVQIDVTKRVGVDLILPVASVLPVEHLVQWQEKINIPMKVLDTLADDTLAKVLIGGMSLGIGKVVAKLPTVGPLAASAVTEFRTIAGRPGCRVSPRGPSGDRWRCRCGRLALETAGRTA
jgi:hypothetical protein